MLEVIVGKELSGSSDVLCNNKDVEQWNSYGMKTQEHRTTLLAGRCTSVLVRRHPCRQKLPVVKAIPDITSAHYLIIRNSL